MVDFDRHAEERYNAFEATGGPAQGGITVLDWFAGKALEGMIGVLPKTVQDAELAQAAYMIAEAMLAERNKRFTPQNVVRGVTGKTYG